MGAHNVSMYIEGHLSEAKLNKIRADVAAQERLSWGSRDGPYTGDWRTIPAIRLHRFEGTEREAGEYCLNHAEKWEYAVAVHTSDGKGNPLTLPGLKKDRDSGLETQFPQFAGCPTASPPCEFTATSPAAVYRPRAPTPRPTFSKTSSVALAWFSHRASPSYRTGRRWQAKTTDAAQHVAERTWRAAGLSFPALEGPGLSPNLVTVVAGWAAS